MSTINGSAHFASSNAFRRSLEDRLKVQAKIRQRSLEELRREFVFQRFLALVFSTPDAPWVLKGGASLLMRLAEARYSKDLDLLHLGELSGDEAVEELRTATAARDGDHLTFVIEDGVNYSGVNPVVTIAVVASIGAEYVRFPVDLARELHVRDTPERIRPTRVVDVPGLAELPEFTVYPLTDQLADKVCAMYEVHGSSQSPSTRYRDLIDLALIVSTFELEAAPLVRALRSESERRRMQLPSRMKPPGPQWPVSYSAYARRTRVGEAFHDMELTLEYVGSCIDPLLGEGRESGRWRPGAGWCDEETGAASASRPSACGPT